MPRGRLCHLPRLAKEARSSNARGRPKGPENGPRIDPHRGSAKVPKQGEYARAFRPWMIQVPPIPLFTEANVYSTCTATPGRGI